MNVNVKGYLICPECGMKTKVKVFPETELKNFPLFCPWCKRETVINKEKHGTE